MYLYMYIAACSYMDPLGDAALPGSPGFPEGLRYRRPGKADRNSGACRDFKIQVAVSIDCTIM